LRRRERGDAAEKQLEEGEREQDEEEEEEEEEDEERSPAETGNA
jgi:hypothetical protein